MDFPEATVTSHYEHVLEAAPLTSNLYTLPTIHEESDVTAKKLSSQQHTQRRKLVKKGLLLKQEAFNAMNSLEGWCSREKASLLIDMILALKPLVLVEIGVFGGKSLIPMAFALKQLGTGKIYGIDPWLAEKSVEGMEAEHLEWWATLDHDKILNSLQQEMTVNGLSAQIELIRTTSEACLPIPNIDLLHIDGNHSEKTSLLDVCKWVPLMNEGGIIIFDDINWPSTLAARNWLDANCTKLVEYSEENVWGIWMK